MAAAVDSPPSHTYSDTYYSPEGDRKRLLPLALRRGLEVFETRREWLAYIFERMHRKQKGSSMPLACVCAHTCLPTVIPTLNCFS